jgi:DNA-binding winged helix-turn-helix (wHTH) protein
MLSPQAVPVRFGAFEFDRASGDLRKRGLRVRLTPLATLLLRALLDTPARLHSREELQRRLWPGQFFLDFEHGLNKVVHSLREALGDTGSDPRFIETVPGEGYRFVAEWLYPIPAMEHAAKSGAGNLVAVLPIQPSGAVPELSFLATRVTSDLNDEISGIDGLRVLAQGTVKSHYTAGASPQTLGETMGVRAVLYGELSHHQSDLFLRMELIDVSDGTQLSSAFVEKPFHPEQIFDKHFANDVVRQLRPALTAIIGRVVSHFAD